MFYNIVFVFPSMCFNFTKWKLYVICKLGFASLLRENWIEINIGRNGTKPQNYPEKFSNSNDVVFNGFTMMFGHFYVRVFLSKEWIDFLTNGWFFTCVFPNWCICGQTTSLLLFPQNESKLWLKTWWLPRNRMVKSCLNNFEWWRTVDSFRIVVFIN